MTSHLFLLAGLSLVAGDYYDDLYSDEMVILDNWRDSSLWHTVDSYHTHARGQVIRKCAAAFCLCRAVDLALDDQFFDCSHPEYSAQLGGQEEDGDLKLDGMARDALVWTGFDFQWKARLDDTYSWMTPHLDDGFVLGAWMTPHRISKMASYVDADKMKEFYSFGPGVDGDYMFPLTKYKAVRMENEGKVSARFGSVHISLQDTAKLDDETLHPVPVYTRPIRKFELEHLF